MSAVCAHNALTVDCGPITHGNPIFEGAMRLLSDVYQDYTNQDRPSPDELADLSWDRFWESSIRDCEASGLVAGQLEVSPASYHPTASSMAKLGEEMTACLRTKTDVKHPEVKVSYDEKEDAVMATVVDNGKPHSTILEGEWIWNRKPEQADGDK